MTVNVKAENRYEAKQIISDNWKKSKCVLDAENFASVELVAVLMDEPMIR